MAPPSPRSPARPMPFRARSPTTSAPRRRCSSRPRVATSSTSPSVPKKRRHRARTPKAYASAVVDSVVGADGLALFVEALILARQRPDLVPRSRAPSSDCMSRPRALMRARWRVMGGTRIDAPDVTARKFWTIALGIALEGHATGRSVAAMSQAMREALGELAEARSARSAAAPALHLVTTSGPSIRKIDVRSPCPLPKRRPPPHRRSELPAPDQAAARSVTEQFAGTWKLVSWKIEQANGELIDPPLGPDPRGWIMYQPGRAHERCAHAS